MKNGRLAPLVLVVFVALVLTGGFAWVSADDEGEPSAAKVAVLRTVLFDPYVPGTQVMGSSMEDLVQGAGYIAVVEVTAVGPHFNGRRAGDSLLAPPDPYQYGIVQLYLAEVERWLKGGGPATIYFGQHEGDVPPGYPKSKAAMQAAKEKSGVAPIQVGSRYVLFLNAPRRVPELDNLTWYPRAARLPRAFALSPDGTAHVDGIGDLHSLIDVERRFPPGPEQTLIQKVEEAVADTRR